MLPAVLAAFPTYRKSRRHKRVFGYNECGGIAAGYAVSNATVGRYVDRLAGPAWVISAPPPTAVRSNAGDDHEDEEQ